MRKVSLVVMLALGLNLFAVSFQQPSEENTDPMVAVLPSEGSDFSFSENDTMDEDMALLRGETPSTPDPLPVSDVVAPLMLLLGAYGGFKTYSRKKNKA